MKILIACEESQAVTNNRGNLDMERPKQLVYGLKDYQICNQQILLMAGTNGYIDYHRQKIGQNYEVKHSPE